MLFPDIVISNGNTQPWLVLGNGTIKTSTVRATTPTNPSGVTTGDLNCDSRTDLVFGTFTTNDLCVLLATGPGTFVGTYTAVSTGADGNGVWRCRRCSPRVRKTSPIRPRAPRTP